MSEPIVKTLIVPISADRAFRLFTEELGDWWPVESHSLSAGDGETPQSVKVTPEIGGPIVETRPDGRKEIWGTVTAWEPPSRFAMTWHVGRPEEQATDVEVYFETVADGTRVRLIHSNWERLCDAATGMRTGYNTGWDMVLGKCFGAACRHLMMPHSA